MKFGPTIKKVRIEKGLLLKELYAGVVGKDFAIKFEKAQVNLNLLDFIEVLSRLSLKLEEFLYLNNDYSLLVKGELEQEVASIINGPVANKQKGLELYQIYRKSHVEYQRIIAYVAYNDYLIYYPENEVEEFQGEKQVLKNYLLAKDLWTLEEIRIFSTTTVLFEEATNRLLIKKCLKTYDDYQDFLGSKTVELKSSLLENYILNCYHQGKSQAGHFFMPELLSYRQEVLDVYRRSRINLCESLFLTYQDQRDLGQAIFQNSLTGLKLLGYLELASNQAELFEKLKEKVGSR
ncbi:Rgg family transcriptional regulator [Vagococcus salmoninarum]|uniref:Rgg family transcriptional regulator n=1 Tax=Vagococcus salmoninarum TaxID=2739 RepID=UPI003F96007A